MPLLPRRRADAVAIDQPEGVPGVVVGELDGDRPTHGVAEHDDRAGLDLVQDGHDLIGQHLHRHVVPVERIASAESGQAGVDDTPAELFGQTRALPPVHAATGEVAVDVDGPDRRGTRAVGPMGPDVVGDGELQQATLDPHGAGPHADRRVLADLAHVLVTDDAQAVRGVTGVGQLDRGGPVGRRHEGAGNLQLVHRLGRRAASWKSQPHVDTSVTRRPGRRNHPIPTDPLRLRPTVPDPVPGPHGRARAAGPAGCDAWGRER